MSEEILNDEVQETEEVKTYDFPEGTIFYQELKESDGYKWLCGTTDNPSLADSLGFLENHFNFSELTLKKGVFYLKGSEKPAETPDEYIARRESEIVVMVQELIDSTAQQKRYDTGESCCSYVGDPDEEFNADAVAFQAWRGRCWRTCYNILNSVKAGTVAPEDVTDKYVLERLPVMEWPTVE